MVHGVVAWETGLGFLLIFETGLVAWWLTALWRGHWVLEPSKQIWRPTWAPGGYGSDGCGLLVL